MERIFEKQGWHLLAAVLLAGGVWLAARGLDLSGTALGLSAGIWLGLAVPLPVIHPV